MDYIKACSNQLVSLDNFAGNRFLIRKIHEFVKNGKNIVIFGPTGCGKTTICHLLKKDYEDYGVYEVNKDTFTTSKEVINNLKWFINNKPIMSFFGKQKYQKIIFIDDYDILVNADKLIGSLIVSEIVPLLSRSKVQMVLTCLTDFQLKKKLQDSLKDSEIVKLTYPSIKDAYAYLMHTLDGMIDGKEEKLLKLLHTYKGCIRDALLHLDTPETEQDLLNYNYRDLSSFEIIKKIFLQTTITPSDVYTLINLDGANIAYMLFENIPEELCKRGTNAIELYLTILHQFVQSAEIETTACYSMDWTLFEISSLLRLDMFRNILNENKRTTSADVKDDSLRFIQVLSKLSHKNIFAKKLSHIKKRSLLSTDTVLYLVDTCAKNGNNDSIKKNTEESNMITTYKKYFT